ncbi:MAG: polyphenol oxidase family protein [Sandaracinaceae bacterium]|nr:polyphenol oxidase family protein [Sandaracinaceae bacterium]
MREELFLRSKLLTRHGFPHGFSTRLGGLAPGAFDRDEDRSKEIEKLAARIGISTKRIWTAKQVHGNAFRWMHPSTECPEQLWSIEADALIVKEAGHAVALRTADCVPILLADHKSGTVAAVHVGWRGLLLGVLTRTIAALVDFGACPSHICAAIGPHIRLSSFEIGEEVAMRFQALFPERDRIEHVEGPLLIPSSGGRFRASLRGFVMLQMLEMGLDFSHIDDVGGDTYAESHRFDSYRRQGSSAGRQWSYIVARQSEALDCAD